MLSANFSGKPCRCYVSREGFAEVFEWGRGEVRGDEKDKSPPKSLSVHRNKTGRLCDIPAPVEDAPDLANDSSIFGPLHAALKNRLPPEACSDWAEKIEAIAFGPNGARAISEFTRSLPELSAGGTFHGCYTPRADTSDRGTRYG
jgi:hypothetical protein